MESQQKKTVPERYPEHLKHKTPIINFPLYNTDKSLFTFFLVEETQNPKKTANISGNMHHRKIKSDQTSQIYRQ